MSEQIEKLKGKAKISMDEMYKNKSVGNMEHQTSGQPPVDPVVQKSVLKEENPEDNKPIQPMDRSTNQPKIQPVEKLNCKITFNTSERLLDEFNELYAQRIIEKRKIDKSALLNEALEMLLQREKKGRK